MLKLYYARPSLFARPVWLALLEKQLPFELIPVDLSGAQFESDFLVLNPFSHIPVLVDGEIRIIESLAILDYLEAQYPNPPLLPTDAATLARVRMAQLATLNELLPAIVRLMIHSKQPNELDYPRLRAMQTLKFLETLLGDRTCFAGEQLTMAEIVVGTLIHRLPDLGVPLTKYPGLSAWSERLLARPTWQQIQLSPEEWQHFQRQIRVMPKIWERRRRQRLALL
jgi:glutathione S-transferase